MRKPMTTLPRFIKGHNDVDKKLKSYKLTRRGKKLSHEAGMALMDHAAMSLKATNAAARIEVAAVADWQLKELFSSEQIPDQLFWITITPSAMAFPAYAASSFEPHIARARVANIFEGIDYYGMIDVAYYPKRLNTQIGHEKRFYLAGPLVSFHIHLLAWNCTQAEIQKLEHEVNSCSESLFPTRVVFHARPVSQKRAAGKNLYQHKAPVSAYTAWADMTDAVRRDTGEIVRRPSAVWTVRKRPLRPGEAAEIHNVLSGFSIPELILCGGRGLKLKRDIISISVARLEFRYHAGVMLAKWRLKGLHTVPNTEAQKVAYP